MAEINPNISVITLSANEISAPVKRQIVRLDLKNN